jgi:hypothetical protein
MVTHIRKDHPMKKILAGAAALAATLLAVPAGTTSAQESADVMLLHGIPGITVDVAVDGAVVIPGFEPGDMQDLSSFAGQTLTNLEVRPAGTENVAIGPVASFDVPASGSWTVVAHLDAEGTPTITPFENDTAAAADGQGRLTVRHTAAAPAVDIVLGEARPVENLSNPNEASLDVPAGEIAGAQVAPTGGDPIADVPTVSVVAGENLIVYAVGSLADETFTFLTQTVSLDAAADAGAAAGGDASGDGTPAPTAVNTGGELAATSNSSIALFAAAAGLFALAGGAMVLRRRTVDV